MQTSTSITKTNKHKKIWLITRLWKGAFLSQKNREAVKNNKKLTCKVVNKILTAFSIWKIF
jgi:hypothetical protein